MHALVSPDSAGETMASLHAIVSPATSTSETKASMHTIVSPATGDEPESTRFTGRRRLTPAPAMSRRPRVSPTRSGEPASKATGRKKKPADAAALHRPPAGEPPRPYRSAGGSFPPICMFSKVSAMKSSSKCVSTYTSKGLLGGTPRCRWPARQKHATVITMSSVMKAVSTPTTTICRVVVGWPMR